MNIEQLFKSLQQGENDEIEFKQAKGKSGKGELPREFWISYSAMANAYGGWIVLGVKESKGQFSIDGIQDIEKLKTDLFNLLNNREFISVNLLSPDDVVIHEIDKQQVLVIRVRQASRKEKPVHLTKNPLGHTYIRVFNGDRLCSDEQIKRMLSEQLNDSLDKEILPLYFSFEEDIDKDSLTAYRNRLSAYKPDHPFLDLDIFAFF
ncbi:helix-turn-helix domain-containing protein [Pelistega sp. MC2]|uniref:AlbA family DNA-binding domain-containing protein n=1 Tax=Pelistega sp. MC2 TaxID=1720297 RepID=UPI0008DB10A3|nr:ATP-binding protein [Pelistega sp. MC2]